jgi:hypothetical protein
MINEVHPDVAKMVPEEVAVIAAYYRAIAEGTDPALAAKSDAELASSLLWLQESGFLTLVGGDDPSIILNADPAAARRKYLARQRAEGGPTPSRRERRSKKRRKRSW